VMLGGAPGQSCLVPAARSFLPTAEVKGLGARSSVGQVRPLVRPHLATLILMAAVLALSSLLEPLDFSQHDLRWL
jgi:hypothetical protein